MADKKKVLTLPVVISIHVNMFGEVIDVAGIPAGVGLVVTGIAAGNIIEEKFFDKTDNCQ